MAPLQGFRFEKVLILLYIPLLLFVSSHLVPSSRTTESLGTQKELKKFSDGSRKLLELQKEVATTAAAAAKPIKKLKLTNSTISTTKTNQTKLLKPTISSSKNQTKLINKTTTDTSTKNQTKLKLPSNSSLPTNKTKPIKTQLLNIPSNNATKKSPDPTKPKTPTTKYDLKKPTPPKPKQPKWVDDEDEDDLVSEFRDLPSRFQQTLLPDLERISTTSKVFYTKANKDLTNGIKPLVGKKYAPFIASIVSCTFILIPLILVSLILHKIKAYFSLQRILIFIQIYLSIYFYILSLSTLVTGLEPLKFFYTTSQSTYICIQLLQTLAYALYLLLLLMYLVLVFSTETSLVTKLLGLGQTFVGFAVGLHYYVTVFHRAVLHQPPKSSWKVDSIYATCFMVICLLDRMERRKKAYLEEGGAEGKKS